MHILIMEVVVGPRGTTFIVNQSGMKECTASGRSSFGRKIVGQFPSHGLLAFLND